jgi:CHAD domain-containing protein
MHQPSNPREYVLGQLGQLVATWSGARDGDVESIHDARVATRRIRAALPFVFDAPPPAAKELRRIGRALGRVRDQHATDALLRSLEQKVPQAAITIAVVRKDVSDRLNRRQRQMVKALSLNPRSIARAIENGDRRARLSSIWRSWRHELVMTIGRRAEDVRTAIDRAPAIYMPNRSHSARIQIKKLRYTAEIAFATGLMDEVGLRGLKQAQNVLGDLHDLDVLRRRIGRLTFPDGAVAELLALTSIIGVETARIHKKYVRNRDRVRAACDVCLRASNAGAVDLRAVSAAAIAAFWVLAKWYLAYPAAEAGQTACEPDTLRAAHPEVA